MQYSELTQQYQQKGKQIGDRIIFLSKTDGNTYAIGYQITSFSGFNPQNVEPVGGMLVNPEKDNWDDVYDSLFGAPSGFPDFTKVANL